MNKERVIVVDGANVAYAERSADGAPRVSNLVAVCKLLEGQGYTPIVIIDASLYHDIDDPAQLEGLLEKQDIRQAPSSTDADYFVLETAQRYDAWILTNDEYKDYRDDYKWIDERRVPYMVINDKVVLYGPQWGDAA
jgi:hypothetical protein